jgi:hypothetical protein
VAAGCAALVGCGFGSSRSTDNPGDPDGGGVVPPDAAADAAIDGSGGGSGGGPGGGPHAFCVGPTDRSICLDAAPTGNVLLDTALDTDKSDADNPCLAHQPASWTAALGPDACFIVGDTVRLMSLRATGARPLVIIAQHQIAVVGTLSVASLRASGKVGAGANPADCKPFAHDPVVIDLGGGGGAGGSFMVQGADGGVGNGVFNAGGQAAVPEAAAPARLRGGCAGQKGGRGTENDGGAGGGAVYLASAGAIDLSTGKVDASGAGGKGAPINDGGGGGGSGGTILLHAATITVTPGTQLAANGGGGGGGGAAVVGTGGADLSHGDDGDDPDTAATAAAGGHGGIVLSQNGGDGGTGAALQIVPKSGTSGDTGGGGGGGGGGTGYIRSNRSLDGATVSPAADVVP